ncbi:hypothetical protein NPIL_175231 [Nephila pilipes]|uniref:Uncharacterized protein n=1 Tax=Nephila pilipes TaxID=299642 RepID=A0A8X6N0Y8_NEPPI|nr:hypothetical protein NPIL_175231 [Nephila pilipes]
MGSGCNLKTWLVDYVTIIMLRHYNGHVIHQRTSVFNTRLYLEWEVLTKRWLRLRDHYNALHYNGHVIHQRTSVFNTRLYLEWEVVNQEGW